MNKIEKLKAYLKIGYKTNAAHERVYILNNEIERDLEKKVPVEKRVKLLRDLGEIVVVNKLEEVRKS